MRSNIGIRLFEIAYISAKIRVDILKPELKMDPLGSWRLPKFIFWPKSYFCVINSVQSFKAVAQPLLGEKYVAQKKERTKKNNNKNS